LFAFCGCGCASNLNDELTDLEPRLVRLERRRDHFLTRCGGTYGSTLPGDDRVLQVLADDLRTAGVPRHRLGADLIRASADGLRSELASLPEPFDRSPPSLRAPLYVLASSRPDGDRLIE
jgi:hypothetical protein